MPCGGDASLDTLVLPAVRMPRCAGRHSVIQWNAVRALHLGSQCWLSVTYRLIGARVMSQGHIRNIQWFTEALLVCTPNYHQGIACSASGHSAPWSMIV